MAWEFEATIPIRVVVDEASGPVAAQSEARDILDSFVSTISWQAALTGRAQKLGAVKGRVDLVADEIYLRNADAPRDNQL